MKARKTSTTNKIHTATLLVVAAGSSTRMGLDTKKEYLPLNNGTVLSECVLSFLKTNKITSIAIAIPKAHVSQATEALYKNPLVKTLTQNIPVLFVEGGATRQESVYKTLCAINESFKGEALSKVVLIHDGARPFVSEKLITACIEDAYNYGASCPALQPTDTQVQIDSDNNIIQHIPRPSLAAVQTPQAFDFNTILAYHKRAVNLTCTDDTEIWDTFNATKTHIILGESTNIKITYKNDLPEASKMIRIGLGYDLHRLVEGRKLLLGGIELPFEKGEDAHSDGDVLLHAITDAVLGAASLGDIGVLFPPSDSKWKDASSSYMLKTAWDLVKKDGWKLENLDCVIALEKPKFIPYREQVCSSIANILEVETSQVFVKAKTGEKLGKIGRSEAVEVWVTCLLSK